MTGNGGKIARDIVGTGEAAEGVVGAWETNSRGE